MDWSVIGRALLQAGGDWFDRDLRHLAKKIADVIRPKLNFGDDLNEDLIERFSSAMKGFLSGLVEQNVSGIVWKVGVEKLIDTADFISSYVFNGTHGVDEWSTRRLARIRQSIAEGKISTEDALIIEELFNRFYADLQWGVDETRGEKTREKIDHQWDQRMRGLREEAPKPATASDKVLSQEMHPEARRLTSTLTSASNFIWGMLDTIGASLDRATHMEFTDEQEAILQAAEDELDRLKTQANFERELAYVQGEIDRHQEKPKRRRRWR